SFPCSRYRTGRSSTAMRTTSTVHSAVGAAPWTTPPSASWTTRAWAPHLAEADPLWRAAAGEIVPLGLVGHVLLGPRQTLVIDELVAGGILVHLQGDRPGRRGRLEA